MVYVLAAEADRAVADMLAQSLSGRGVTVVGVGDAPPADTAVVALLSSDLADQLGQDAAETLLQGLEDADAVIPVNLDGSRLAVELSQLDLHKVGIDKVAEAVALVIESGSPSEFRRWRRLADTARQWRRHGSVNADDRLITDRNEMQASVTLLGRPIAMNDPYASVVRDYVEASRRRLRGRSRITSAAITASVALLTAVAVTAALTGSQLRTDAARARAEAAASESARLAGIAIRTAGTEPDLPWLLAHRALTLDPHSDTARRAGHTITGNLIPHRTLQLRSPAGFLSVARNGIAAVSLVVKSGFDLIDTATLTVKRSADVELRSAVLLAPSGKHLSYFRDDGALVIEHSSDGVTVPVQQPPRPATSAAWLDDRTLLVGAGGGVVKVSLPDGVVSPLVGARSAGVRDIFVTPERSLLTVIYDDQIQLVDTRTAMVTARRDRAGVIAEMVNPSTGQSVSFTRTQLIFDSWGQMPHQVESGATALDIGTDGDVVNGEFNGAIEVFAPGIRRHPTQFFAHQGTVSGVAALGKSRYVSVGYDGRMRVWDFGTVAETMPVPADDGLGLPGRATETSRRMLSFTPDTPSMLITRPSAGQIAAVDRRTGRVVEGASVDQPGAVVRVGKGGYAAAAVRAGAASRVYTMADFPRATFDFQLPGHVEPSATSITVAPDGNAIAVAAADELFTWVRRNGVISQQSRRLSRPDRPVLSWINGEGSAFTVGASGTVHFVDGDDDQLPGIVEPVVAAGATSAGVVIPVTQDGRIWTPTQNGYESRMSVGATFNAFATAISNDDRLIAVMGPQAMHILDLPSGTLAAAVGAAPFHGPIQDVRFDDDSRGFTFVRESGAVGHRSLLPGEDLLRTVDDLRPRTLTEEEEAVFSSAEPRR